MSAILKFVTTIPIENIHPFEGSPYHVRDNEEMQSLCEIMLVIRPADCVRDSHGVVVGVAVIEKSGRHQVAPVLAACRTDITRIVDTAIQAHGSMWF